MVKYCVANEVSYECGGVCTSCRMAVISRYSNTYAKKSKRLGVGELPIWRLKMVIFIYSNTLLSESMINTTKERVQVRPVRPLGLFEVLARNRQSTVELFGRTITRTTTNTPNVYNTSSTITVLSHAVGDTKEECYAGGRIHKEKERDNERER